MPFWKKMFNKRQGVYYREGHIFMSSRIFL